jgi:MFS transporter, putative metabolite:H+ symporter
MGGNEMTTASAAELAARLDRLPMARHIWVVVILIFFTPESLSPFSILAPYGVAGVGTFVFALFAGLFVGAIVVGCFADRWGAVSAEVEGGSG